jgi:hypothetical protein
MKQNVGWSTNPPKKREWNETRTDGLLKPGAGTTVLYSFLSPLGPLKMSKQILAVRHRLCPQTHTPSHTLAPPTLPLRSLDHEPFHTFAVPPTSIVIAMPSLLSPQPPPPEHHPAPIQPRRTATTHRWRSQGCRKVSRHHGEGFGGQPPLPF